MTPENKYDTQTPFGLVCYLSLSARDDIGMNLWDTQTAFALFNEYNNKIGINERFKCIIKSKMEPAMAHTDYVIHRI
jgi:hypothetical protein